MDLYEYQGKELFARFGIPVSEGRVATTPAEARRAAEELGGEVVVKAQVLVGDRPDLLELVEKLYRCFTECDATLCEINPLVVTPAGEVIALDAKVTIDDSALFRHPDLVA